MKVDLRKIEGNWNEGYALDKHIVRSTYTGDNEYGRPTFDTVRTEAGQATFLLKYRADWDQVEPLATAVVEHIVPRLQNIGLVIPVPASKARERQPVYEVARAIAAKIGVASFEGIVSKSVPEGACVALKDLGTKEQKVAALDGRFAIHDTITSQGAWNALVVDDLFDTGASMEAVCSALRTYKKISKIYVATLTWK